jgi:hypothetical protein
VTKVDLRPDLALNLLLLLCSAMTFYQTDRDVLRRSSTLPQSLVLRVDGSGCQLVMMGQVCMCSGVWLLSQHSQAAVGRGEVPNFLRFWWSRQCPVRSRYRDLAFSLYFIRLVTRPFWTGFLIWYFENGRGSMVTCFHTLDQCIMPGSVT